MPGGIIYSTSTQAGEYSPSNRVKFYTAKASHPVIVPGDPQGLLLGRLDCCTMYGSV